MDEIDPEILNMTLEQAQRGPISQMQALEAKSHDSFPSNLSFLLGYISGSLKITPDKSLLDFLRKKLPMSPNHNHFASALDPVNFFDYC